MEPPIDTLLSAARRCLFALHGGDRPYLLPMAFWSDGRHVWMTTPAGSPKVRALRRNPSCRILVDADDESSAALLHGRARVHGIGDPLGLVLHGPMISTAMAALALKDTPSVVGASPGGAIGARVPPAWIPRNRVALRVEVHAAETVPLPEPGPGIAPPLPAVVPPDVRRALAGVRRVAVATRTLDIVPAVWDSGFRLETVAPLPDTADAAVTIDAEPRAGDAVGLSLGGPIRAGRLEPRRATWWHGFAARTAAVPAARDGIALPE